MLFQKYWKSRDPGKTEKIVKKVRKEDDINVLVELLNEFPSMPVKEAAMDRLAEKSELAEVFLSGKIQDKGVNQAALEKIGEEGIYTYAWKHLPDARKVMSYLGEDMLLRLVKDEENFPDKIRESAFRRIKDPGSILSIACMAADSAPSDSELQLVLSAFGKLDKEEDILSAVGKYGDARTIRRIVEKIQDPQLLETIAKSGNEAAKERAAKKVEERRTLEAMVDDASLSLEKRARAAMNIANAYSDYSALDRLKEFGIKRINGHVLLRTIYREWEQVEYVCLRCGKTGGQEDDSESTRHYGCRFASELCAGSPR